MDGNLQKSPQLGYPIKIGDAKYISGLSTILVATIQEAKDRISQIEYIFCSQLFPNFQSKSKSLQKIYSDARNAAEDAWKEKESDFLLQIETLQLENKMILEENQSLKFEKAKFVSDRETVVEALETKASVIANSERISKEHEEEYNMLLKKQRTLELEAQEIRVELFKKSKEVDDGMEMQRKLLQLVQTKASLILQKEKQLKEQEEKKNELLVQIESLQKILNANQEQLSAKTSEVMKERELQEKLLKDNNLLTGKVQNLEGSVNELQKELMKKNKEVELERKLQEQYLGQIDLNVKGMLKITQQLEELEKENKLLLAKRKGLEEKVDKLQADLRERANETSQGMELHGKLLKQIEEKDFELQSEKKKRRDVISVYKNLKSQYNFLLAKFGLNMDSINCQNKMEDESNSSRHSPKPLTSPDDGIRAPNVSMVSCEITKEKVKLEDCKGVGLIQRSKFDLPSTSNSPAVPMGPSKMRSSPLAGTKRPGSSWRDTRSHQQRGGLDPHDDFLDTPLENIVGNIKKPAKEEVHDLPDPAPKDINLGSSDDEIGSSDDETQQLNGDFGPQKPLLVSGTKGFKYIAPVRKKAEREHLKGIECKQCRKFYDAVLPDGGDKDADGNKQQFRCEHHVGVSRHRYRYAPPLTPEGFWNIGFESEM